MTPDVEDSPAALRARERQQAAVARLGQRALAGASLPDLLDEGAASAARELSADFSKVLELLPGGDYLLMRAGVGWKQGLVGSALVEAGRGSQAGYTLLSEKPVVLADAETEDRFAMPPLHHQHHITSGVSVIISGADHPFGIIGVYTSKPRTFSQDDIHFLESLANVLATAIEQKQAEAEREHLLAEVREFADAAQGRAAELQSVLNTMLDGVIVLDAEGRITLVNNAGTQMLGLQGGQSIGLGIAELSDLLKMCHPDGRTFTLDEQPLYRALAGETVVLEDAIVTNVKSGRSRCIRLNGAPILLDDGRISGAVTVTRDVTSLVELDKMKDQFISVAAHELKTPVAVMKGYAQALLRTGTDMPVAALKMLDAIDRGADRIDRVVKDLLEISRLQLGKVDLVMERIYLPGLVAQVADRLSLSATKHHIVIEEAAPVAVLGDRYRLEQVVVNLLDNAMKYTPSGGKVSVRVITAGPDAVVEVSDRGVGIPRERQGHIFERFYRAHAGTAYDYGGMGVGLYISKQIVGRHGGKMWFESRVAEGSVFSFSLPIVRGTGGHE
jgi:two-component system, OmpR family, sensor histidine kinase VicK